MPHAGRASLRSRAPAAARTDTKPACGITSVRHPTAHSPWSSVALTLYWPLASRCLARWCDWVSSSHTLYASSASVTGRWTWSRVTAEDVDDEENDDDDDNDDVWSCWKTTDGVVGCLYIIWPRSWRLGVIGDGQRQPFRGRGRCRCRRRLQGPVGGTLRADNDTAVPRHEVQHDSNAEPRRTLDTGRGRYAGTSTTEGIVIPFNSTNRQRRTSFSPTRSLQRAARWGQFTCPKCHLSETYRHKVRVCG